jgi:hypothetical protein
MEFEINGKCIQGVKSTVSHLDGDQCLYVGADGDVVQIAESEHPDVVVTTSRNNFGAFIEGVKAGQYDTFAEPVGALI